MVYLLFLVPTFARYSCSSSHVVSCLICEAVVSQKLTPRSFLLHAHQEDRVSDQEHDYRGGVALILPTECDLSWLKNSVLGREKLETSPNTPVTICVVLASNTVLSYLSL